MQTSLLKTEIEPWSLFSKRRLDSKEGAVPVLCPTVFVVWWSRSADLSSRNWLFTFQRLKAVFLGIMGQLAKCKPRFKNRDWTSILVFKNKDLTLRQTKRTLLGKHNTVWPKLTRMGVKFTFYYRYWFFEVRCRIWSQVLLKEKTKNQCKTPSKPSLRFCLGLVFLPVVG